MAQPGQSGAADVDQIDLLRAHEYSLLAMLLARPPGGNALVRLAALNGDNTALGAAHNTLAGLADSGPARIEREFFELFIGVGRGELLPYGSYYQTGFLNERPLARLRDDLAALGIERDESRNEPEDHIAILCEIMAGMASGRFPADLETQHRFFARHLQPWAGRFFADLERAEAAGFYRAVGTIGRLFMAIEADAFLMADWG